MSFVKDKSFIGDMFLVGQRFGLLVVLRKARRLHREQRWKCKCDCGKELLVTTRNLLQQKVVACSRCMKKLSKPTI